MVVTREMQREGEQQRWKDFENRRVGVRESASRRSFGAVYLKPRVSFSSYPFQPRVVRRVVSVRMRQEVCQDDISCDKEGGKSEPRSRIHDTVRERGGGEKIRAPMAEYVPAPPITSNSGGLGGR